MIGVLLLLLAAFAVGLAVNDTNRQMLNFSRANLVGQQALRAASILNEMEAAERGYVLTGDDGLRGSFRTASEELTRLVDGLEPLTMAGEQRQRLERLQGLVRDQIVRAGHIVALVGEGRNDTAVERLRQEAQADPMVELKGVLGDFIAGNERSREAAETEYETASRRQLYAAMGAAFAILVFGLHQVTNTYRFMRQLSSSQTQLRQANIGLEDQVATRTEELAETVMRFQVALRAANVVVFSQDAERRFTWSSRDILGASPSWVIGKREEEVFDPDVAAAVAPVKEAVLATEEAQDYQYGARVDGEQRWFRSRAEPLRDEDGRVVGIVGAVIDVTSEREAERRSAETSRELAETLRRLDVAMRGADIFVFTEGPDRRITFASPDFLGRPAASLIGLRDEDFLPADVAARVTAIKASVARDGEPIVADLPVLRLADGAERWMKLRVERLRDGGAGQTTLIGCAVDVTREKTSEHRLRALTDELDQTIQRFQIALRGADVTVFTQDRDLRFTWLSSDTKGPDGESIVGRTEDEILVPELASRMRQFKMTALSSGEPQHGEFRYILPDGDRWYFVRVEAQRDEIGEVNGLLGAAVDVTERRQRELHNRVLLRELTHRTKNLLAVVQAMARQTLTASSSARDFEARFSGRLLGLARSLDILVDENWEGALVAELVRSQLDHYSDVIGTRIVLDGPELLLEPEAAQQIGLALHELSTNSARYGALSDDKGRVFVTWWRTTGPGEGRFHFEWVERGGPAVQRPERKGFGHAVLERLVPRGLGGAATLDLASEGLVWRLEVPDTYLSKPGDAPRPMKIWAG
ncbi:PAS domain-containing protein [Alsobacter sp. SYSU M60028]|uniref:Blue-light-activated histidine kinase n=1 Tax=Alsobacter ponti TaxID=2962936 RepID=A0ABT1L744_9HYPH|nr:PAS domain-containing protein [Alsobacter ponti]